MDDEPEEIVECEVEVERLTQKEKLAYLRGVKAAAQFIGEWDSQINHPYRMEDVILCKFNIRRGKPRKKKLGGKSDG